MLILISPSTTMNFNNPINIDNSIPYFINDANSLVELIQNINKDDFKSLFNLSDDLANINLSRYKEFNNTQNTMQSILCFTGEVFSNLDVSSLSNEDLLFLNNHLRIFSGLYGLLKPFDLIKPYRLEMKTNLENNLGKNLYNFWNDKLTNYLISELNKNNSDIIINLASTEYIKCLDKKSLNKNFKFIDIEFKEFYSDLNKYKVIGMYSKQARGKILRFITINKVTNLEDIKKFNTDRYEYNHTLSSNNKIVFTRNKI